MNTLDDEKITTVFQDSSPENPWIKSESKDWWVKTYEIDWEKWKIKVIEVRLSYIFAVIIIASLLVVVPWDWFTHYLQNFI